MEGIMTKAFNVKKCEVEVLSFIDNSSIFQQVNMEEILPEAEIHNVLINVSWLLCPFLCWCGNRLTVSGEMFSSAVL